MAPRTSPTLAKNSSCLRRAIVSGLTGTRRPCGFYDRADARWSKSKELMPGKGSGKVRLVVKLKKSVFRPKEKFGCFCPVRFTEENSQYEQFTLSVIDLGGSHRCGS